MNRKIVGLSGAAAVVIGLFCPLFNVPFLGNIVTYASQRQGEGALLGLVTLIGAAVLLASEVTWPSVIAGAIVLIDVVGTLSSFADHIHTMQSSDNVISRALAGSVSPSFGFAILGLGAVAMILSIFIAKTNPQVPAWDRSAIYTPPPPPVVTAPLPPNLGSEPIFKETEPAATGTRVVPSRYYAHLKK